MPEVDRNHADGRPRRLAVCVQNNPNDDEYYGSCCRFPKTCSPYPYAETPVTESDLEPRRTPSAQSAPRAPLLTEVLTLSDEALIAFVDFIRLNDPASTRNPGIIRRVFTAYVTTDEPRTWDAVGGVS